MPNSQNIWILNFIKKTTQIWESRRLNPRIFGYQIQPGTKWLEGIKEKEIQELETRLGFNFPEEIRHFLLSTNGLDREQINMNASDKKQEFQNQWNLTNIERGQKELIEKNQNEKTFKIIKEENIIPGIDLKTHSLLPIYGHRFAVCNKEKPEYCQIISIHGDDIIMYGESLKEYLEKEFLKQEN